MNIVLSILALGLAALATIAQATKAFPFRPWSDRQVNVFSILCFLSAIGLIIWTAWA